MRLYSSTGVYCDSLKPKTIKLLFLWLARFGTCTLCVLNLGVGSRGLAINNDETYLCAVGSTRTAGIGRRGGSIRGSWGWTNGESTDPWTHPSVAAGDGWMDSFIVDGETRKA